jgi:hypothetical protein
MRSIAWPALLWPRPVAAVHATIKQSRSGGSIRRALSPGPEAESRMETVWYTEPSGDYLPNPTVDQMLGFMRQEYDGNWGPYSPVGVLRWYEHSPQPEPSLVGLGLKSEVCQLLFVRHPERGWFFEFSGYGGDRRWLAAVGTETGPEEWVQHWACGEQTYFLASCFVPQPTAEQVVTDFLATKEPSPAVLWAEFDSLEPRRDSPPRQGRVDQD